MQQHGRAEGYSIFHETMADMTYPELERAAADGAVVLWALGVIEQHGPHLPLATDVYIPSAILRRARAELARRGIPGVIAPPFYWGVNHVTGRFPGSFEVRAEIMVELLADAFRSFAKDGFGRVFCLSGHGDALHNRTIFEAVRTRGAAAGLDVRMIASPALARRLGIDPGDPHLAQTPPGEEAPAPPHLDVHAGQWETSLVLSICPGTVRAELLPQLEDTRLGPADLAEWRKGQDAARRVTPRGYFGDPSAADAARGEALLAAEARAVADAVADALGGRP
jgi:creatinine amidohydrolase